MGWENSAFGGEGKCVQHFGDLDIDNINLDLKGVGYDCME
jgi:hypothetical protein